MLSGVFAIVLHIIMACFKLINHLTKLELVMEAYISQQLKFIHHYAKHLGVDDETAAIRWVSTGLAKRYAIIYRTLFFQ